METSILKPLSGREVVRAILYDIEQALTHDDRFAAHVAYDGFTFHASIQIRTPSAAIPGVDRILSGGAGAIPPDDAPTATVTVERPLAPPNQVRMDTEQPVPVLSDDGNGKVTERWAKHRPKDADGQTRAPRNKVVGGGAGGGGA